MKIVKLKGGLGNQMFQYAFMRLLEEKYNCTDVLLDMTNYINSDSKAHWRISNLSRMNVNYKTASRKDIEKVCFFKHEGNPLTNRYRIKIGMEGMLNPKYYFESDRKYRDVNKLLRYTYFDGYWQSWKYLEPIKDIIKNEFTCDNLSEKTKQFINYNTNRNSIFVGVRRGDYINNKKVIKRFGTTDIDYYVKAVQYMCSKFNDPLFIFFSDDIEWVIERLNNRTLNLPQNLLMYRNKEDITDDFEELFIMKSCKHAIISNSTFNFWGAWLIDNTDKIVIAPNKWLKDRTVSDIVPGEWVRM